MCADGVNADSVNVIYDLCLQVSMDESDSNFMQLLKLRIEDDRRIINWLDKKTDKYTAPDMQNEILKVMSQMISREIAVELQSAPFLTIMEDETTNVSNKEQLVICFRWVDKKLEAHEEFVGLSRGVNWSQHAALHYM